MLDLQARIASYSGTMARQGQSGAERNGDDGDVDDLDAFMSTVASSMDKDKVSKLLLLLLFVIVGIVVGIVCCCCCCYVSVLAVVVVVVAVL